jgi:ADP-ribose pyrophosphatase YjhB (NUDIX family)
MTTTNMTATSTTATSTASAPWPRLAASAAIFREGRVLIGERGKGALQGHWSLPGGHVEPGETAADAARRETLEETSVTARILGLVDLHEVIRRDAGAGGTVTWHYAIAVHFGVWVAGEPVPASDCRAARFVKLDELGGFQLTDGAKALIHRAARLVEAAA